MVRLAGPSGGEALALALALALTLALIAAYWNRFWFPTDEGNYAHVAERILDGEVLNRDVQDVHAGYVNFLNAAALAAFGRRMASLRLPLMAATLLQAVVVFRLFGRRDPALAALAAVAASVFGVLQYLNPTAHWYALLLFFGTLLVLDRLPREARCRQPLVGLALGLLSCFRQLSGVLAAMGVLTYLLLEAGFSAPARGRSTLPARLALGIMAVGLAAYLARATDLAGFGLFGLWPLALLLLAQARPLPAGAAVARMLARLAAGALVAALPLVVYHALHGSLAAWYGDAVGAAGSIADLGFIRSRDFASSLVGGGLAVALRPRTPAWLINGLFWTVLPLLASVLGFALVLRTLPHRTAGQGPPPALPLAAAFYGVVSVHFQNSTYLFFGLAATVAGLLWLAAEAGGGWRRAAALGTVALGAVAVPFHAGQTANRGELGLLTGARGPVVAAAGIPRCGLRIDPRDLEAYRAVLDLIARESAPGEAIFAVPSSAELYFLSQRRNPFRFFNFALGVRSEAEARALVAEIERRPPSLLLYDGYDKYNTPLSRWTMVQLARRYELLGLVGRWEVFRLPASAGLKTAPGGRG